jgi:diguanylate cyclase (GGDEF)-like protein/PAS domain S-box-containing protein
VTSSDDRTPDPASQDTDTQNSSDGGSQGVAPADRAAERFAALEQVGQHSLDLMIVVDQTGAVIYANPVALDTFGISLEEGMGTSAFKYLHPDDVERVVMRFIELLATPGGVIRDTVRTLTETGEIRELEIVSTNSIDNAAVGGIIINAHDITEHRQYVEQLREHEERFRLAFEGNMAPMIFTDLEDRVIAANEAFCQMIGFSEEELLGKSSEPFTYPEDVGITEESHRRMSRGETGQSRYVKRYLRKDGRVIYVEVSRSPARDADGKTLYFVISERDITEERVLTEQLSHQALHDPLTGLPNRALFDDRLEQAHARILRQGGQGAVLLLDLDDFKGVNDSLGHLAGDQMLRAVAGRLEQVTRSTDTLCRFGGDEFLYLAEGLGAPEEAEQVAARLIEALSAPFMIAGTYVEQHASIGVVVWDATRADNAEFVQEADVALYEAKREGKGHYVVFTPSMHQQAISRFALTQELRHAFAAGEISMHYQPILNLATSEIEGFEALMRWNHPQLGYIAPSVFIPLAEQSELILDLGLFAIRESVAAANTWDFPGAGHSLPYVTVNLSAHQFHDPNLVAMVEGALAHSGLAPERLVLEITESVTLLYVAETMSVMEHLSRLGISFALDDFGTGFSSLSYLALLHPRIIKIDRTFVSPTLESVRNDALLEAIVSLGHKLDMTMLAEGIETPEQLERLRSLGCELGQGFLFSAAVPAEKVQQLYERSPDHWY